MPPTVETTSRERIPRRQRPVDHDDFSIASCLLAVQSQWRYMRQYTTRGRLLFFLKQHIPILEWLPTYDIHEDLQYDLVAGITVAMMIVPEEISLSTMMGVPPIYGLYTAALVPMIYPFFGTSRVLSVANGAEVCLLVGSAIKKIESEEERVATGILLCFLSGLILLMMGIFRLGILADFFSRPVMGGFISAGGCLIMLSQCGNWLDVKIPSRDLPVLTLVDVIQQLPHVNGISFLVGSISIVILVGMKSLKRRVVREMSLLEVALAEEFEIETSHEMELDEDEVIEEEIKVKYDVEMGEQAGVGLKKLKLKPLTAEDEVPSPRRRASSQPVIAEVLQSLSTRSRAETPSTSQRLDTLTPRSCRQHDISLVTRNSTRHRTPSAAQVLNDEGIGFSLSDEDYLHLEQPLEYSFAQTRSRSVSSPKWNKTIPRELPPPQVPAKPKPLAVPSTVSEGNVSVMESTRSTTALTGMDTPSTSSIRLIRSKLAVLIALRLVCDLGSSMVCLLGGIIGYLTGPKSLTLTGNVPGGYPSLVLPWYGLLQRIIDADRLYHIVIDTLSIAIISYMSSIAMAKRLAIKEGYRIRPNQELIALGFSNLFGSFFQAMPATGGLSRTAVNMQNARTQLASLITVGMVIIALYTATSALAYLPKASLAAIIIVAGHSLLEVKEAAWLYRVKKDEFYVWLASFILTCVFGVLPGLLSSIFCSLVAVIYKTRRPMLTMLGELTVDDEKILVDLELYPDTAIPFKDIIVLRVEGALYFANCEYVERVVIREIQKREHCQEQEDEGVDGVIIDAGSIIDWDSTTIQMMKHLQQELHAHGVQLSIVHARDQLQHLLESSDFLHGIVQQNAQIGFLDAITTIREQGKQRREMISNE